MPVPSAMGPFHMGFAGNWTGMAQSGGITLRLAQQEKSIVRMSLIFFASMI